MSDERVARQYTKWPGPPDFATAYARITSEGWMDREEATILYRYAGMTGGDVVEVGTHYGRSAMLLAQLGRPLHCVDSWDDSFPDNGAGPYRPKEPGDVVLRTFIDNVTRLMGEVWCGLITYYRVRVEDWNPVPAGFVYLDGDHSYEGTAAQIRKGLACRPTYLAMHDVGAPATEAVTQAALNLLGPWRDKSGKVAVWGPFTTQRDWTPLPDRK